MVKIAFSICAAVAVAGLSHAQDYGLYEHLQSLYSVNGWNTNAEIQAELASVTAEQWMQYADMLAATNKILFQSDGEFRRFDNRAKGWNLLDIIHSRSLKMFGDNRLSIEYDAKFADAGLWYNSLPLDDWFLQSGAEKYMRTRSMSILYAQTHTNQCASRPAVWRIAESINSDGFDERGRARHISAPEYINILVEALANHDISPSRVKERISEASKRCIVPIRRKIREDGGTFVVGPNGENPAQDAIDNLVSAFESPNCAGVREWTAEWFPNYNWVDVSAIFPSAEYISALRESVFYGEKELTETNKRILSVGLGLDGYNRFIEEYNGTK